MAVTGYQRNYAAGAYRNWPSTATPLQAHHYENWEDALEQLKYLLVDPRDFGAVGDGATDCAAPIQSAIDEAFARGGAAVVLPEGTWLIGAKLLMKTNVHVIGRGRASVVKIKDGTDISAIDGNNADSCLISDVTIDCNKAGNPGAVNGRGIMGTFAGKTDLHRVRVINCSTRAVDATLGLVSQISNCYLVADGIGANVDSADGWVRDSYIYGAAQALATTGYPWRVTRNHLQSEGVGYELNGFGVVFTENIVEGCATGLKHVVPAFGVDASGDYLIANNFFKDLAGGVADDAIVLTGFDATKRSGDVLIIGNTVNQGCRYFVNCTQHVTRVQVIGNRVRTAFTGAEPVNLGAGCSDIVVLGNDDNGVQGNGMRYHVGDDGRVSWGDGTNPVDTNLYRVSADSLRTDDFFSAYRSGAASAALGASVTGDATNRLVLFAGGVIEWGDGAAARDTNLYRGGANILKTDDSFHIAAGGTAALSLLGGGATIVGDLVVRSGAATQQGFVSGYHEMSEIADPAAPAANKARIYARDNGAGKTQLVVLFPTGAVQVIATEP